MISLIPAAGRAERMGGLPKMLLPVPGGTLISVLIERMRAASPRLLAVGTSPRHYEAVCAACSGVTVDTMTTQTMSETVLHLHERRDTPEWTLFGMPDTFFEDADAFVKLASELKNGADVAVGVFLTRPEQRSKLGMVEVAGDEVLRVVDKPAETDLVWAWGVLAWKVRFWEMINVRDPHVGYALPRALAAELDVRAVKMEGRYFDCGTPEEYFALIRTLHEDESQEGEAAWQS